MKSVTYEGPTASDDQSSYITVHDAAGDESVRLDQGYPKDVPDGVLAVIEGGIEGHKFTVGDPAGDEYDQLKGAALDAAGAEAGIEGFSSLNAGEKRQALRDHATAGGQGS